jgi:hypothetical protein
MFLHSVPLRKPTLESSPLGRGEIKKKVGRDNQGTLLEPCQGLAAPAPRYPVSAIRNPKSAIAAPLVPRQGLPHGTLQVGAEGSTPRRGW